MYFWKIESLKNDIVNEGLSDSKLLPYLVIYMALTVLIMEGVPYFPYESYNDADLVMSLISIIAPIAGLIYAYKKNGGANGHSFASKYFSIGFVVGIRFLYI